MRDHLRDVTHEAHLRLHGHQCFGPLVGGAIVKEDYIRLLKHLLGYHIGLEAVLGQASLLLSSQMHPASNPSELINLDLEFWEPGWRQGDDRGLVAQGPKLNSYAAKLGCLYVREGANIGGRSLAKKLDHLCGKSTNGRAFFCGQRNDREHWTNLCAALNKLQGPEDWRAATQAATDTFALFESWMNLMEPIEALRV